jgi:hypothetical protein
MFNYSKKKKKNETTWDGYPNYVGGVEVATDKNEDNNTSYGGGDFGGGGASSSWGSDSSSSDSGSSDSGGCDGGGGGCD